MVNINKGASGHSPGASSQSKPGWLSGRSYGRSKSKAADYLQSKEKLTGLLDKATRKAGGRKSGLKEVWGSLMSFFRLIRAYLNGSYRQVSTQGLLMIVAAVVYFVSPIDLIPDFILGLGLIDDATVLAWTIRACASDLAAFLAWESGHPNAVASSLKKST